MSFGGPPPNATPPSGPFESALTSVASSPYAIALGIFTLNIASRFLPFEITKGQEQFLNQPIIRRLVIFAIFFVATRNLVTAAWLAFVTILSIGYLFNENSSLYLFGNGNHGVNIPTKSVGDTLSLTPEEQQTLKVLSEKADKVRKAAEKPIQLAKPPAPHKKYQQALETLWLL